MKKIFALYCVLAVLAGCAQTPQAPQAAQMKPKAPPAAASPEARAQLAPTGALRVAVLTSNPIIGAKDPRTGRKIKIWKALPLLTAPAC